MIPYFCVHFAKQTMCVKSLRFQLKKVCTGKFRWVSLSSNPLQGAKGISGTPGKI